jgi:hypothetical protein
MITWPVSRPISLFIRRLSRYCRRCPSISASSNSTKAYSAVPTPTKMSRIVNALPTADSGRTSLKPTVVIVVTV